jgi:uncharacterized protein
MHMGTSPVQTEKASPGGLIKETPAGLIEDLEELAADGRAQLAELDPDLAQAVAFTHFDTASSHDNLVTVLLARADLQAVASQMLVRIKSREDNRSYLGTIVRGPFSEPDAIPPNSTIAVSVVIQGKKLQYTFDYHGRAEVELLGEEIGGALVPPRYRPRPKSPVFAVTEEESAKILGTGGDLSLGQVVGYQQMEARINSQDKSILPRHTAVIGTTGGGKSTTVSSLIYQSQAAGVATVVFDVEGEYTHLDQPTDQPAMLHALRRRGIRPDGVKDLYIHHLVGRDTTHPRHKNLHSFSLKFSSLSPYAIAEILEMSDAQQARFLRAYDVTKLLLADFGLFPTNDDERRQELELDELSTGYPRMAINHVLDVISTYISSLTVEGKAESEDFSPKYKTKGTISEPLGLSGDSGPLAAIGGLRLFSEFRSQPAKVRARVTAQMLKNEISWKALAGKLHRLRRLGIFDVGNAPSVDYRSLLTPGRVSVIDLSDTDSPQLNNLVIADILRGLQETQEQLYQKAVKTGNDIVPTLIVIEEAHEFLSAARIRQMPVLFEHVARIAKRGRKRWLGLVFVTQLPQHLPNEVLGLVNNFIIHKITDSTVVSRMQRTVGSIDEGLWGRVPRLAPGQALMSFTNFATPLMVAIDPAPCKRLLVE